VNEIPFHPLADIFPLMEGEEFDALVADIKANGLHERIVLDHKGRIIDGRNRYRALRQLGIHPEKKYLRYVRHPVVVGNGFSKHTSPQPDSIDEINHNAVVIYVISKNIHRRHLTAEQKRALIAKLIAAQPEKSDRAIAKQVKADHKTVAKARKEAEATGEASPVEKRVGADGKARKQPTKKAKPAPTIDEERDPERFEQLELPIDDPEASAEAMKAKFAALDDEPDTKEARSGRDPRLDAEWMRFRRLQKPLIDADERGFLGDIIGVNLSNVDEIDEALGEIEKHVAAWNAIAKHLKTVRTKAASFEPDKAAAA
jgi:hypothetical protein